MKLLIATNNAGKVRELGEALGTLDVEIVRLDDLADVPDAPEETGTTFVDNALLKARFYLERTGIACVADDSGLEVAALDGRPGVYSARYGGAGATDADRVALLLGEMESFEGDARSARFVCALALVDGAAEHVFVGECPGHIHTVARGSNGFGYDPIFIPTGETRTFAELTSAEKASHSHRGRAFRALARFIIGDG
jgi:XTP/dITP diphosphohydrolase